MPYRENNGRWRGVVKFGTIRRTKFFDKKKDAAKWEDEMRRELEQAQARQEDLAQCSVGPVSIGEWLERYLDHVQNRITKGWYEDKRRVLRWFIQAFGKDRLAVDIRPAQVISYLAKQAKQRSGNAANADLKHFVSAWRFGVKFLGFPTQSPFAVDKFPETRKSRYVPPLEDFIKVLDVAEGQDRIQLLAYFYTAARKSELLRLRWDEVDFKAGTVRLWTRKRKNGSLEYDDVPMPSALAVELRKHKLAQPPAEHVFTRKSGKAFTKRRHLMKHLCDLAGVKHFTLHGIRHLAASVAMESPDVNLLDVKGLLRHQNLTTTQRYVHRMQKGNKAHAVLESVLDRDTRQGHVNEERVTAEAVTL